MKNNNFVIEEQIELQGFDNETFNVVCFDGVAIATSNLNEVKVVNLTYPKIKDLSDKEETEILEYRGLPKNSEIHFGDVMMRYGVQV